MTQKALVVVVCLAVASPAAGQPAAPANLIDYVEMDSWRGEDCPGDFVGTGVAKPCRVRTPWSETALRARWAAEGRSVWADGDTLTFIYEGNIEGVTACCTVQMPLSRIVGTDLWALSVRVPDLPFATLTAGFLPKGARAVEGIVDWRGASAPVAPPQSRTLRGTVRTDSLWSEAIGERRAVTVYLPPEHNASRPIPVVYVADGESVHSLAAYLEPFILAGEVPSTILVGIHSGPMRGEEYTSISEAANAADPENVRFVAYERFVLGEVIPWAERTLGASARREERAAFGFSNGGVWAAHQGVRNPDVFGVVIPFSCGVCRVAVPDEPTSAVAGSAARFYFLAGRLEVRFHENTASAAARLRAAGYVAPMHERVAGHDPLMWYEQFGDAVRWAFGHLMSLE